MAEDSKYVDSEPVSIYVYVNKGTDEVDAIFTFNLIGTGIRRNSEWDMVTRQDPVVDKYLNSEKYDVWKVDWEKEPIIDADPADKNAWEHQLVQAWDKGEKIDTPMLEKYASQLEVVLEDSKQEN